MTSKGCILAAFLLLSSGSLIGQNGLVVVSLTVKLNGKVERLPDAVTLSYDSHSVQVPIRNGHFDIPSEVLTKEKVTFSTTVGTDKIRVTDIYGGKFGSENWTLILEDRRFDVEFLPMPKGAKVRSSCVLVFESKAGERTILFDSHCRSKSPRDPKS